MTPSDLARKSDSTPSSTSTLVTFSNDLAGAVERAGRSLVAVNGRPRIPSSGILWRSGVVVTADHTLRRDSDLSVTLSDGRTLPATLAGRDASSDLAILSIEAPGAPAADIGDSSALRVGHLMLALGRPGGSVTAALALISAVATPRRGGRAGLLDQLIRLDAAVYDGFSGGALVDAQGTIVGLNTSAFGRGAASAIPAATVNRVVDQLLATGRIPRGYLGVAMQPVRFPGELTRALGIKNDRGVILVSVEPRGPAAAGGATLGDVVIEIDGQPVADVDDVMSVLGADSVGRQLRARVIRGGVLTELTITVGERPSGGK
jgi:S1-C subfamily serine protease